MRFEPIAIVGRACLLPGADTPDALWKAILDGRSLVTACPDDRWRLDRTRVLRRPGAADPDRAVTDRGGFVTGFDAQFEAEGFAVDVETVQNLDTISRWLLHTGRAALRDAGMAVGAVDRAGAILGNLSLPTPAMSAWCEAQWLRHAREALPPGAAAAVTAPSPSSRFMSGLPALMLARALGLSEGAFALDAACASSLYAIKLACDRLHDRSADVMLAGAVNHADSLFLHIGFSALHALSPSGRSRPFHREADGLLIAEGCAMVVLKRLSDAERAGDRILGVIRAVGLSNDGRGAAFLSPAADGQERAMRAAYEMSGLRPEAVSLAECHATGTRVGDATELASLGRLHSGRRGVPIGSVKSNLGHPVTVAGLAGLLKVLGALEAGLRPPTINCDQPLADLAHSPFRLLTQAESWEASPGGAARLASISAFGFGGNNAHLLVEEYRPGGGGVLVSPRPAGNVAIIAAGVVAGAAADAQAFAASASTGVWNGGRIDSIGLDRQGLRFPPADLAEVLPQQILALHTARTAVTAAGVQASPRVGVIMGMGTDTALCRWSLRWRLPQWEAAWAECTGPAPEGWSDTARDTAMPRRPNAAVVVGTLPNVVANRLNSQFDFGGASMTVSAEDASGTVAVDLAARALRAGELDVCLAGAVDLADEPAHAAAMAAMGGGEPPADAAVVLVLKREEDARRDGDPIIALLPAEPHAQPARHRFGTVSGTRNLLAGFGHAHAAAGLLQVTAAALAGPEGQTLDVAVRAMDGSETRVAVFRPADAARPSPVAPVPPERRLDFPAHLPPFRPAPWRQSLAAQPLPPAPALARIEPEPDMRPEWATVQATAQARSRATCPPATGAAFAAHARVLADAHQNHLARLAVAHSDLIAASRAAFVRAFGASAAPPSLAAPPPAPVSRCAPVAVSAAPKPLFDRQALEIHASGRISEIFGPLFAPQDGYALQVRMPEPPLLLADRVMSITGPAGKIGRGAIVTETDVRADAWYMHCGRMPFGLMLEAGQADLMLISWQGVDLEMKGERAYRLLGCDLTLHGGLPGPGDTLHFDIHIDGHARHGDIRLFFFHYDLLVNGEVRAEIRNAQAGFFTARELAESGGILWTPDHTAAKAGACLDPAPCPSQRRTFDTDAVRAFAEGRAHDCFGPGFEAAATHQRTPAIQSGRMQLIRSVPEFEPQGGPWGRGYLRAVLPISPDDWYFACHFKGDPCMPGTLMLEGCLQALAFHMAGLGFTLGRDGWRFEPVPSDDALHLSCRGQVSPTARELVYELFVDEVVAEPYPMVFAHVLCSVDGLRTLHCHRLGLRLVPDWPVTSLPRPVDPPGTFGPSAALEWAKGQPSRAFGPLFARFDDGSPFPRIPAPPFLFLDRCRSVSVPAGTARDGAEAVMEYTVPAEAWYSGADAALPFSMAVEFALQTCGYLQCHMGGPLRSANTLHFRIVDVTATVLTDGAAVPLRPGDTIAATVTVHGIVNSGPTQICTMTAVVGGLVRLAVTCGLFPSASLQQQQGITPRRPASALPSPPAASLPAVPALRRVLHRISGFDAFGGAAGLGHLVAERDIEPGDWVFRAHFFQDPVQPASFSIEAMMQAAVALLALLRPEAEAEPYPVPGASAAMRFRGQILPRHRRMTVAVEVAALTRDEAELEAWVGIDDQTIHHCRGLRLRLKARRHGAGT